MMTPRPDQVMEHWAARIDPGTGMAEHPPQGPLSSKSPPLLANVMSGDNNVNTIRCFLALMVLWSHSFALYYGSEAMEPISVLTRGLYNAGNVAVAGFLILSGVLVLRSWEKSKGLRDFAVKRARRLYPAYLVAVFICAFVVAPIYAQVDALPLLRQEFPAWLVQNLLFRGYMPLSNVFVDSPVHAVNGSLWSISFEVLCYIGLVAGAFLFRLHLVWACWIVMAGLVAAKCYADITGWNPGFGIIGDIVGWPYLWFSVGGWFVTGMLFYLNRERIPRSRPLLIAVVVVWALVTWLPAETIIAKIINNVAFTPIVSYILFYVISAKRMRIESLFRKYDVSYGMYLYAFPIQQIVMTEAGHNVGIFEYFAISAIFTLIVSLISWMLIERKLILIKIGRSGGQGSALV